MNTLLEAVRRYADTNADSSGFARTAVPGLSTVCAIAPSDLIHAVTRPMVCLVLQGAKNVTMGTRSFDFAAGESLLVTADVPTVSKITRASIARPYYALVLELDPVIIAALAAEMKLVLVSDDAPVRVDPLDVEVADAALRLMRLVERPSAVPLLRAQLMRELHYWLLSGRHGTAIRALGWPGGHAERVARAVALLRAEFARPMPVERLAAAAGMSPSSFHYHFRAITSLSPLQFQKHLRLIEARRLMISDAMSASNAAFAVGYESVTQFTREYGRLFGTPPVRDVGAARRTLQAAGNMRSRSRLVG